MCPLRAGIFLNFLWHRLHSTGFDSVVCLFATVIVVEVGAGVVLAAQEVLVVVVTFAGGLKAPLDIVLVLDLVVGC